jgi:hypothetical protein
MARRITVKIEPNGDITAEASGAPGSACLSSLQKMQELLPGAKIVDSKLTPEFYQAASSTTNDINLNQQENRQ